LYRLLVLKQLSHEKDVHEAVSEFILTEQCEIDKQIFSMSNEKYQLNRLCSEQITGSLQGINRVIER